MNPHSVNNMIISDLGSEEILLCACDDGDVIGYHTKDLLRRIPLGPSQCVWRWQLSTLRVEANEPAGPVVDPPRCCFHENVGRSAWGLAVHKEARLIAASSNTHQVTVWAPALTSDASVVDINAESDEPEEGLRTRQSVSFVDNSVISQSRFYVKQKLSSGRAKDQQRILAGHESNIPCIAFCNTSQDLGGRYLASTCIDSTTLIWDVDGGYPARFLRPVDPRIDDHLQFQELDEMRAGWGVIFLDIRSFSSNSLEASWAQAEGQRRETYPHHPGVELYDITKSRSHVRNAGTWVPFPPSRRRRPTENEDALAPEVESGFRSEDEQQDPEPIFMMPADFAFESNGSYPCITRNGAVAPEESLPKSPIMLLCPHAIHLFQSPAFLSLAPGVRSTKSAQRSGPVTLLRFPLAQRMSPALEASLAPHDRMNLFTQIPELGVVLVGSPVGRVAVITLHRLRLDPTTTPDGCETEPFYTMRLDHLLPTKEQERANCRPMQQLVGISASPIFGHGGEASRERWRVILLYRDNTVLAYELAMAKDGIISLA